MRNEVDKESVNVSMEKVMGASADNKEKDTSGGSIMSAPGKYSAKNVPDVAKRVDDYYSGYSGTEKCTPNYQGEK